MAICYLCQGDVADPYHELCEDFEYAQKMHLNGDFSANSIPMVIEQPSRLTRIRRLFFTPRGALVYFGIGYALIGSWLFWMRVHG